MTSTDAQHKRHNVQSEARGPHWVAWVPDAQGKPQGNIVLVGLTREEAEKRAIQRRDEQTRLGA